MAEFPGHKYGINCVAFAPNNKYIVSVSRRFSSSYHCHIIVNHFHHPPPLPVPQTPVLSLLVKIIFSDKLLVTKSLLRCHNLSLQWLLRYHPALVSSLPSVHQGEVVDSIVFVFWLERSHTNLSLLSICKSQDIALL